MAAFNWETYRDTPGWKDVSTGTFVFSGSASDHTIPVTVGEWQSGTHITDGDPGNDSCGANHSRNVKYVSGTQFDSGGGTETLNTTNMADTECTLRVKFTDASQVATSSARFYTFDGSVVGNRAVGLHAYAFERISGLSGWTLVNDDTGGTGGDNSGQRLSLADQAATTDHYFYVGISSTPESVGAKTSFDLGLALTYS